MKKTIALKANVAAVAIPPMAPLESDVGAEHTRDRGDVGAEHSIKDTRYRDIINYLQLICYHHHIPENLTVI